MDYAKFEKQLLGELNSKNEECLNTIENNEKLIKIYLQNIENDIPVNNIVKGISDMILNEKTEKDDFILIKKVLCHPLMKDVLEKFKESDILIKALKEKNTKAQNFLLGMNIRNIVDESGDTVPLYLLEQGNIEKFNEFIEKNKIFFDINHHNKKTNECIISILIKKYKDVFTQENSHLLLNSNGLKNISHNAPVF